MYDENECDFRTRRIVYWKATCKTYVLCDIGKKVQMVQNKPSCLIFIFDMLRNIYNNICIAKSIFIADINFLTANIISRKQYISRVEASQSHIHNDAPFSSSIAFSLS